LPLFAGPRRVWLFILALGLVCAGVWAFDISSFGAANLTSGPHLAWWELAVVFYLAEVFVVHLHFRKQAHTLSLTEIGLVLGLFLATPANLLVAQAAGTALALALNRRQRPLKLAFNVIELPLCTGIAVLLFRSLTEHGDSSPRIWAVALVAAAVAHAVGVVLVSLIIAVAERRFVAPQLGRTLVTSLVAAVATASLALAAVELVARRPLAGLLLVAPVFACVAAFRGYVEEREQREHVEFLYESMRATQGAPEFGLAVGQLLVAARRLLRAEYAEILLLSPTEHGPPLRSVSGSAGEVLMRPEDELDPDDARAFEVLGDSSGATVLTKRREAHSLDHVVAARGLDDGIVGPLRGENGTFGLLIVGGRAGDASTFSDGDLELFETFAGHASILLENGRLEHSLAEVTELKEQLRHQAYHDSLTGLPNRVQFVERVAASIDAQRPGVAVLFLDLDRFKDVNDTWGHGAGDELLVQVAQRLVGAVRGDDLPARLGGDEFAVLLEGVDEETATLAAQRISRALSGTYDLTGGQATTHASIGIAVMDDESRDAATLVRNADIAMYSAKRSDQRRFALYEPSLHDRVRDERQLAIELELAVQRGEIEVHYQPVVRLSDGICEGYEALARWNHPERGLLPAAAFLATAEENGIIVDLGRSVIRQALAFAETWPRDLALWINLAPAELTNDRLVEELAVALANHGMPASRLTVEITESSVIRDEARALKAMRKLRDLGVHLTIDDFGTGYSSLSRLAEFPIESLKIPKPFVDKLTTEQRDDTFVDAILRLADSLGLVAVAEGIEDEAQVERLRELGCTLGQGYLFAKPQPASVVAEQIAGRAVVPLPSPRLRASA
jgi:diguanylate cyclase (GGDEF)-like protein